MKRLLFFPLLAAVSCQTQTQLSDSWGSLPVLDRVEVAYHGALLANADQGLSQHTLSGNVQPEDDDPGLVHEWNIKMGFIETSSEAVARLFGEQDDTSELSRGARVIPHELMKQTLAALVDSGDGVMISDPSMRVLGKTRATMSILNQTAFVDHFNFEVAENAVLVDPEVEVFADGLMVDVIPQDLDKEGKAQLQFHIACSELVEMHELKSAYPYRGQAVTLQVPLFMRQDLSGTIRMGPDEAVALPVMLGENGRRLLIFIRLDRMEGEPVDLTAERQKWEDLRRAREDQTEGDEI